MRFNGIHAGCLVRPLPGLGARWHAAHRLELGLDNLGSFPNPAQTREDVFVRLHTQVCAKRTPMSHSPFFFRRVSMQLDKKCLAIFGMCSCHLLCLTKPPCWQGSSSPRRPVLPASAHTWSRKLQSAHSMQMIQSKYVASFTPPCTTAPNYSHCRRCRVCAFGTAAALVFSDDWRPGCNCEG